MICFAWDRDCERACRLPGAPRPRPTAVTGEAPLVDADDRDRVAGRPRAPDLEAQVERFDVEELDRPRRREAERRDSELECHADAEYAEVLDQTAEESHANARLRAASITVGHVRVHAAMQTP